MCIRDSYGTQLTHKEVNVYRGPEEGHSTLDFLCLIMPLIFSSPPVYGTQLTHKEVDVYRGPEAVSYTHLDVYKRQV